MDQAIRLLPSIVYIYNQDTQSNEYSNRSMGEVMGYSPEEVEKFGSNLMALLCHPDDLPQVFQHFKRIARLEDGDVASVEYRVRHKEGHWLWFLSLGTVFDRHPDGRVQRHLGSAADITNLKAAERRAVEASRAAQVANQDLRAFAYSISHDMKSPLNTLCLLLSELDGCHGDTLDPDAKQLLDKARQTSQNMQRRIERVMDYTRMIDQDIVFERIELDALVQDVLSDMEAEVVASSAIVEVDPLPVVSGCAEELKVLFQNLIANALKFHAPGVTPHVRIFDSSDGEESERRVTVSDNGIGIPPDQHAAIFDLFKRLHSERQYPGSGLGLAICRRIAISHGGGIFLKSRKGMGASFTVELPCADHCWRKFIGTTSPGCEVCRIQS